ncbi:phage tail protein [Paenibacillus vini]|uniref:phage tail protein n=1 Tax=Paenibacillus vini TaxID=1476024 RepID=UPI0025B69937|nr:phage tail protein [Paenibacillus vini]MDN4069277.1 phage tail protein [Paenibacillus vini]MDN4069330.1 phage tail protein [Paenibacillus vini]
MAKTTWSINDTVQPQDMNNIGQEINQLREDVDNIEVPPASLTMAGIVQLSNATNGSREDRAATEKALGEVMQEAQAGKQAGIDRKAEVVAALNSIGVSASTSESWAQLIPKMASIIRATGNATVGDVIAGKTFSNASANGLIGTIPDQGAGGTVTPGTTNQTKAAGRYTSAITILGDPDLVAGNLPKDVNIFNVQGILERLTTTDRNAIIASIVGKGVAASAADSNAVLAQKIGQIQTGKKFVEISIGTLAYAGTRSVNFGFVPRIAIIYYATAQLGQNDYVSGIVLTPAGVSVSVGLGAADVRFDPGTMSQSMTVKNTTSFDRYNVLVRAWE